MSILKKERTGQATGVATLPPVGSVAPAIPRPSISSEAIARTKAILGDRSTQHLAGVIRLWNHTCRCNEAQCSLFGCQRVKPTVEHQRLLKSRGLPRPCAPD